MPRAIRNVSPQMDPFAMVDIQIAMVDIMNPITLHDDRLGCRRDIIFPDVDSLAEPPTDVVPPQDRIAAVVALIGKAFLQRKALLVYAPDAEVAGMLDRQLWTHPPTGFIPHVRGDSPLAAETPVLITTNLG